MVSMVILHSLNKSRVPMVPITQRSRAMVQNIAELTLKPADANSRCLSLFQYVN